MCGAGVWYNGRITGIRARAAIKAARAFFITYTSMNILQRIMQPVHAALKGYYATARWLVVGKGIGKPTGGVAQDPYGSLIGWAGFALNKVAMRFASVELELYSYKPNEVVRIEDDELLALLDKPNPTHTGHEMRYLTGYMLAMWGEAPIALLRAPNTRKVVAMYNMRPDLLKREYDTISGEVVKYQYGYGSSMIDLAAEDVIHIKVPSPADSRVGHSPLLAAAMEIDADIATALWNRQIIDKGGQPNGVLETDGKLSDEQAERIRAHWEGKYSGPENAGKVAVLEGGLRYKPTSATPKELDYTETRRFNRDNILVLLGVPKALVIADDVNRANAEAAAYTFAMETIKPLVMFWQAGLNAKLVPEFDETYWLDIDNVVPDNQDQRRQDVQVGVASYVLTPNEAREMYGKPPVEGGDVIYMPFGMVPSIGGKPTGKSAEYAGGYLELKIDTKRKTLTAKEQRIKRAVLSRGSRKRALVRDLSARMSGGKVEEKGQPESKKFTLELFNKGAADDQKLLGEDMHPVLKADRLNYLRDLPKKQEQFKAVMVKYFNDMRDEVAANVAAQYGKGLTVDAVTKAVDTSGLFNWEANKRKLQQATRPAYSENIGVGATAVAKLTGGAVSDYVETPAVQDFLRTKPTKLAEYINETTLNAVRDTLAEGVGEGEGLTDLVGRISAVFEDATAYRAEMIARTEVGSAQNFGRANEMQAQGVEKRMWVAAFVNTRDDHAAAHGQVVGVDEPFSVGGEDLMYPQDPEGSAGETINCMCSVAPLLD